MEKITIKVFESKKAKSILSAQLTERSIASDCYNCYILAIRAVE